jgi:hypothetical protein
MMNIQLVFAVVEVLIAQCTSNINKFKLITLEKTCLLYI